MNTQLIIEVIKERRLRWFEHLKRRKRNPTKQRIDEVTKSVISKNLTEIDADHRELVQKKRFFFFWIKDIV